MKRSITILSILFLAYATPFASGQVQRIQGGNVLDANPQQGSAGLNNGSRQYSVNTGNRIVSGNVTGGAAFRGFSPIRDPSSLFIAGPTTGGFGVAGQRTGLPSDQISAFQRDAFNASDLQRGRSVAGGALPYYSTQGTVTNTGAIIAGLNRPGTSQVQSPYVVPRAGQGPQKTQILPDQPISGGTLLKVPAQIARIDTGQLIRGPVNERLLNSPLFGAVRMVPGDVLANQAATEQALGADASGPLDQRVNRLEPLDVRVNETALNRPNSPRTAMERVLGPRQPAGADSNQPQPLDRRVGGPDVLSQGNADASSSMNRPAGAAADRQQMLRPRQGRATDDSHDIFSGMRMASGQFLKPLEKPQTLQQEARVERDQQAPTASLIQPLKSEIAAAQKAEAAAPQGLTVEERIELAKKMSSEPIKSFVGTEESAINKYLAEAEALMRDGQYYKAANVYDLARTIDVSNPLPLLGRAMSLLVAGEYMSSATNLFQAIRLFEELANFPLDLTAFIPDVAALDRRRADLERRLESFEDYRLRFLLGYAEYNSGLQKLGLTNMKKAAESVPPEWAAVPGFVKLLERRQLTVPATQPR